MWKLLLNHIENDMFENFGGIVCHLDNTMIFFDFVLF